MNTSSEILSIANIDVEIVRKDIKNMHLAVYPPSGRVRLATPMASDSEVIRLFAISKLGWIKKQIKNFNKQPRETIRTYSSGESHYFQGKRFLLDVIETPGRNKVEVKGYKTIQIASKVNASIEVKANMLKKWYRKELKKQIPELIEKWENVIGVKSNSWGVKQMRTKWGACNIEEKRIWINLELAKKPTICLEYIIVHELVHLLERNHNEYFVSLMDEFMPKWRLHREQLNSLPVAHNDWEY